MFVEVIGLDVKKQCLAMAASGLTHRQIYNEYFLKHHKSMTYQTFSRAMRKWKNKYDVDSKLLEGANLAYKFTPHGSTVQIDKNGSVVQAWIKQHTTVVDTDAILAAISALPPYEPMQKSNAPIYDELLEIPLYDMHFGIAGYEYYKDTLFNILNIIEYKHRRAIFLPIGQDLFHCNDFRGHTANGTQVETVNIPAAFCNARDFYFAILTAAIQNADKVYCSYTYGNHDECIAWAFFELLKQAFGEQAHFDDSVQPRKCFSWEKVFIGYGHADKGRTDSKSIRCQFTVEYPTQFAKATIREIHLGHLHTERTAKDDVDESGIMVRRLSSGNITDDWHNNQGYVGNHKRFMLFEYAPDKLKSIHYV